MASHIEDSNEPNFEWLNEELFVPIFEKELNLDRTEFSLKLESIKPAVGKGENYIAQVTRVQVAVTLKNAVESLTNWRLQYGISAKDSKPLHHSFIIKSDLSDTEENEWSVIEKEVVYYADVIPKLIELDETFEFTPRCFFTSFDLNKSVFIEDLSPLGFKMPNRYNGLDFDHCKLFFEKLGAYHALTASCYDKHGRFDERFHESIFIEKSRAIHTKFFDLMFPVFLDIFRKYDNLKPFYKKIKKWEGKLIEMMERLTEAKYDEFNVLNHGDSWTNNLLYKYDAYNKPIDLRLIDHQLSAYGSPVQDILYFFISSPNIEIRENKFDELLFFYHENLVANLKRHNYPKPIPTLSDLQMAILEKGSIGCLMVVGILAFVLVDANETGSFTVITGDSEESEKVRYNFYNNPRYIKTVEASLKFLDNLGLFIE